MTQDQIIKASMKLSKFNQETAEVEYYEHQHEVLEFKYNPSEALSDLLGNALGFSQDWQE